MKSNLFKYFSLLLISITVSLTTSAQTMINKQDLSIFPKAEKGFKKMIIEVPYSKNDQNKKIEFYAGKWMEVDGCNYFSLQGTFEKKDLAGWGFNYYIFRTKGEVIATQIGCPTLPKRNLFVSGLPELLNYNGRLPIVIYVPEEYQVHFKIYASDDEEYIAAEEKSKG